MNGHQSTSTTPSSSREAVRAVLVPFTLFVLAALLGAHLWRFRSPVRPATPVPAWAIDTATIRQPSLRPEITIVGYTYRCSACHKLFPPRMTTGRTLTQHRDIVLKHGLNDRCLNCHHPENRDVFVDDVGGEIPYDQPQLLCARCHGPVYRDWLNRSHGRTNGYWDTSRGPMWRSLCTQCHQPHQPPFPPMPPAPGPHTLRMGEPQAFPGPAEEQRNPLLIYQGADGNRQEAGGNEAMRQRANKATRQQGNKARGSER
jgi:hypothetical protein